MTFLRRVINNWFNFAIHQRVYSTVYSVLSECLWKNFTGDSGGIRTHDLLLTTTTTSSVLDLTEKLLTNDYKNVIKLGLKTQSTCQLGSEWD